MLDTARSKISPSPNTAKVCIAITYESQDCEVVSYANPVQDAHSLEHINNTMEGQQAGGSFYGLQVYEWGETDMAPR